MLETKKSIIGAGKIQGPHIMTIHSELEMEGYNNSVKFLTSLFSYSKSCFHVRRVLMRPLIHHLMNLNILFKKEINSILCNPWVIS